LVSAGRANCISTTLGAITPATPATLLVPAAGVTAWNMDGRMRSKRATWDSPLSIFQSGRSSVFSVYA
jgi:hypothetical protein